MTLPDDDRRNLNHPTVVWRKWTAATRVKKPKPRSAGVSATEHGRARATIDQLQGRVNELNEELASAQAGWVDIVKTTDPVEFGSVLVEKSARRSSPQDRQHDPRQTREPLT
jgi:hypothetical protein